MLKAIETSYAGCRFRSRTEARWAVFFDALGIPWEYEKEGYELPSGWYLPDFWLPEDQLWVEIKGQSPTEMEMRLARELAEHGENYVFIFHGLPNKTLWLFLSGYSPYKRRMIMESFSHELSNMPSWSQSTKNPMP